MLHSMSVIKPASSSRLQCRSCCWIPHSLHLFKTQLQPIYQGCSNVACPQDSPRPGSTQTIDPTGLPRWSWHSPQVFLWPMPIPVPTPTPALGAAGLPKTLRTHSLQRVNSYTKLILQDQERWLFQVIHRNEYNKSQNAETQKYVPRKITGNNPRKRTKCNKDKQYPITTLKQWL